ncbi:MAG: type II toxin-antitoxin system RelE/ParE family toxin [Pyrinomonadaceae bacterium]|nr:type II toxin-antitoxin system RelE/ParE family toxin [Pyrinomonadaceae bacterium]
MDDEIQSSYPTLQFTASARIDIGETWQYFGEFGEDVAEKLIRQIIEKCEALSTNPKIGRARNDLILNLRQFPFKNYNIFYFQTESGIEIYRVLHSSRNVIQVFDDAIDDIK